MTGSERYLETRVLVRDWNWRRFSEQCLGCFDNPCQLDALPGCGWLRMWVETGRNGFRYERREWEFPERPNHRLCFTTILQQAPADDDGVENVA